MKCKLCDGNVTSKTGEIIFDSTVLGKVTIPKLSFTECANCGDRLLTLIESEKAIDYLAEKETVAIKSIPIGNFISANEAAKILQITKQAFSKHSAIKRGLIYNVEIDGRKLYDKNSVLQFKRNGNGKYILKCPDQKATAIKGHLLKFQQRRDQLFEPYTNYGITITGKQHSTWEKVTSHGSSFFQPNEMGMTRLFGSVKTSYNQ